MFYPFSGIYISMFANSSFCRIPFSFSFFTKQISMTVEPTPHNNPRKPSPAPRFAFTNNGSYSSCIMKGWIVTNTNIPSPENRKSPNTFVSFTNYRASINYLTISVCSYFLIFIGNWNFNFVLFGFATYLDNSLYPRINIPRKAIIV